MKTVSTYCGGHRLQVGDYVRIEKGRPRYCPWWAYRLWRVFFKPKAARVIAVTNTTFTFTSEP